MNHLIPKDINKKIIHSGKKHKRLIINLVGRIRVFCSGGRIRVGRIRTFYTLGRIRAFCSRGRIRVGRIRAGRIRSGTNPSAAVFAYPPLKHIPTAQIQPDYE